MNAFLRQWVIIVFVAVCGTAVCADTPSVLAPAADKQWGYVDASGNLVIPQQFAFADSFCQGYAAVILKMKKQAFPWPPIGQWAYIDISGKVVYGGNYSWADRFSEGMAAVCTGGVSGAEAWKGTIDKPGGGKWGFIDISGKEVIAPQFTDVSAFSGGLAAASVQDTSKHAFKKGPPTYGFIDRTGSFVIQPKYYVARGFSQGLAAVNTEYYADKACWGFIDKTGNEIVKPQYIEVGDFCEGLAAVATGKWQRGKWGYIDTSGKVLIETQFDEAYPFHCGLAAVRKGKDWCFINKSGANVIGPLREVSWLVREPGVVTVYKANWDKLFSEGVVPSAKKDKWGYTDVNGAIVLAPQYDSVAGFSHGYAAVRVKRSWGFIDKSGKMVIQPSFKYVGDFTSVQ